ncbi:3'-5' exonuclease [Actinomadura sp. KC06]|uniref:3'-5' exonuclease n=1 Tax=Actinomadura sp. KC06 TaxID=2530369 RepID=UPI001050DE0C|nr:3'-5' exonuclease [Actinomadura sp. KC06]TDD31227.1 3'-5' exonuclease [Actinomadura sp. KC06]
MTTERSSAGLSVSAPEGSGPWFSDRAFPQTTFVVIDFETLTPAGRPAEPIEVAAVAGRFEEGGWQESGRFESLMRPPADVPVTSLDTAQTGITSQMLSGGPSQAQIMQELDARLTHPPYRLVAHHAATEAGLIAGQRRHCPTLARTPLLCTVKLARTAFPELSSHRLDALLKYLRIPVPADRHRAMPDVEVTVQVFQHVLAAGLAQRRWSTLAHLDVAGGVHPPSPPAGADDEATQEQLFEL